MATLGKRGLREQVTNIVDGSYKGSQGTLPRNTAKEHCQETLPKNTSQQLPNASKRDLATVEINYQKVQIIFNKDLLIKSSYNIISYFLRQQTTTIPLNYIMLIYVC